MLCGIRSFTNYYASRVVASHNRAYTIPFLAEGKCVKVHITSHQYIAKGGFSLLKHKFTITFRRDWPRSKRITAHRKTVDSINPTSAHSRITKTGNERREKVSRQLMLLLGRPRQSVYEMHLSPLCLLRLRSSLSLSISYSLVIFILDLCWIV